MRNTRTPADWLALFEQFDQSGLSQAAFCRTVDVNPKYFSKRRRDLLKADDAPVIPPSSSSRTAAFVSVQPITKPLADVTHHSPIILCYGDIKLQLDQSIDPHWLIQLLRGLQP